MRLNPRFRPACITLLWVILAGVAVRQCELSHMANTVQDMEKRIRALERRPVVRVTVGEEGKALEDGNDSRDNGRHAPDRR